MGWYLSRVAPQPIPGDSAELAVCAASLKPAHRPGYGLWMTVAHGAKLLPIGNAAWKTGLLSALCGGLALGLWFRVLTHWTGRLPWSSLGVVLALFCPAIWLQCLRTEVYAFGHVLLTGTLLVAAGEEGQRPGLRRCLLAGLFTGLAIGHHPGLFGLVVVPGWLLWRRRWSGIGGTFVAGLVGWSGQLAVAIRGWETPLPNGVTIGSLDALLAYLFLPGPAANKLPASAWDLVTSPIDFIGSLAASYPFYLWLIGLVGIGVALRRGERLLPLVWAVVTVPVLWLDVADKYEFFAPSLLLFSAFIVTGGAWVGERLLQKQQTQYQTMVTSVFLLAPLALWLAAFEGPAATGAIRDLSHSDGSLDERKASRSVIPPSARVLSGWAEGMNFRYGEIVERQWGATPPRLVLEFRDKMAARSKTLPLPFFALGSYAGLEAAGEPVLPRGLVYEVGRMPSRLPLPGAALGAIGRSYSTGALVEHGNDLDRISIPQVFVGSMDAVALQAGQPFALHVGDPGEGLAGKTAQFILRRDGEVLSIRRTFIPNIEGSLLNWWAVPLRIPGFTPHGTWDIAIAGHDGPALATVVVSR